MDQNNGIENREDYDNEFHEEQEQQEQPQKQKKTRGPTKKKTSKTLAWTAQFNEHGQPIGHKFLDYSIQLGVITRTKVPITHETWKQVSPLLKDQIWLELKAYYRIINDDAKTQAIRQASERWKAFKTTLRNDFMYQGLSPCEDYKFIEPETWEQFIIQEDTPPKRARREKGRLNALKKKNPPRLGPLGYRGKEDEWNKEQENPDLATPVHFFWDPRSRCWTLARMPPDETGKKYVPPAIADVVDEMASYNEKLADGTWEPSPGEDVLIQVMGKEHPGRLRVKGSTIGIKKGMSGFIKKPRKNRSKEKYAAFENKMKDMFEQKLKEREVEIRADCMKAMEDRLSGVQMQMPLVVTGGSPVVSPVVRSCESASNVNELPSVMQEPRKCVLFLPDSSSRIKCATGMLYHTKDRILHGSVMRPWCEKVQVDNVDKKYYNLDLSFAPEPDMGKLGQALKSFIQWPSVSIALLKPKTGKKVSPTTLEEGTSNPTSKEKADLQKFHEKLAKRPVFMQNFHKGLCLKRANAKAPIIVEVSPDVFFSEEVFHFGIQLDDIRLLLTCGWLDCGIVAFYAMCLHNQLMARQARQNKCLFLNPYQIQDHACATEPTNVMDYLYRAICPNLERKSIFILPNYQGNHWSLFILVPQQGMGFILDSLKKKEKTEWFYKLTNLVNTALGKRYKWTVVDCNQQEEHWECGYYVMRWMYEFVISQQHDFPTTVPWNDKRPYTKKEIDSVVGEWIGHFMKINVSV